MRRIILAAAFLIFAATAVAQQQDASVVVDAPQHDDSARLEYVTPYRDHFFMWPVLKQRSLNFRVQYDKDEGNNLTYRPNKPFSLGFGVYVFDLGLEFTWALPINEHSEERFGNSWSRDLQINALSKNWGADVYYQKYEGFYIKDSKVDLRRDQVHPQRADIDTRNFGISGVYVLNHEKYSFRTAFTFSEKQLKNKGSFLFSGTINSFRVQGDSAILDDANQPAFGEGSAFKMLKYTTIGVSPGYGYNVVFGNFFANATLTLGPAHNWITYREEDGTEKSDVIINLYGAFRIGVGYNGERFFAGLNYAGQSRSIKFEDIQFTNSSGTFRLLVGYRFKEFGILKKSVWDIPKAIFN